MFTIELISGISGTKTHLKELETTELEVQKC